MQKESLSYMTRHSLSDEADSAESLDAYRFEASSDDEAVKQEKSLFSGEEDLQHVRAQLSMCLLSVGVCVRE